ncbi:hypothetical protein C8J57DRAFT_1400022 [Mycena rebaudengoi]|nr:hypothetical protein C8J57DRAFT_1400022 [Mycena rebaudengoi]
MTSLLSETRLKRTSSVLCRLSMFLSVALYLLSPVLASPLQAVLSDTDGAPAGWLDPRTHGGRLLDYTTKTRGEPLNVIISGTSDPEVLTERGLHNYAKSIGFSEECLGLHVGDLHLADLGDGDGRKPEVFLARQHYFPVWGTCWESLAGGHHFRAWKQNGTHANTGAWFLGASKEETSRSHHTIVANGYNLGRDYIVERAVAGGAWKGVRWRAEVAWQEGLLEPGRKGVNHNIAQDGRVAILTVLRE